MKKCIFLLSLVFVFSGCKEDKSNSEKLYSKLRSCDLLTAGEMEEVPDSLVGYEECTFNCILHSDCDSLYSAYCDDMLSGEFELCVNDCLRVYGFLCYSEGTYIPPDQECDVIEHCMDGSDEVNCPEVDPFVFVCDNGEEIFGSYECDGFEDCMDGSDEVDCPEIVHEVFICDNGEEIPESWECDGEEDCMDGSDEFNCPESAKLKCY